MQAERTAPYSAWKRRRKTEDENGRVTRWVEYGPEMSDAERDRLDLQRYEMQRTKRQEEIEKRKRRTHQDPSNSPEELLPVPKNLFPAEDGYILTSQTPLPEGDAEGDKEPCRHSYGGHQYLGGKGCYCCAPEHPYRVAS
jgi:hypothetical protein